MQCSKWKGQKNNSQQSTTQKTKNTETDINQWRPGWLLFFCPFHFEHCIVWPSLIYVCLSIFSFLCSALSIIVFFCPFHFEHCIVWPSLIYVCLSILYNVQNEKDKTNNSQQSTTQKTKNTETDVNQWRPDNTMFKMKR
jgi:hypothetical protein